MDNDNPKRDVNQKITRQHKSHKLKEHHKKYIVGCLARFQNPLEIQQNLKKLFEVDINKSSVAYYDPDFLDKLGRSLSDDLQIHYDTERERFRNSVAKIPIANQTCRFTYYQKMVDAYMASGNYIEARKTCIDAAKELGGMFIAKNFQNNVNNISAVIPHEDASFTDDQLFAKLNTLFAGANARAKEDGSQESTTT